MNENIKLKCSSWLDKHGKLIIGFLIATSTAVFTLMDHKSLDGSKNVHYGNGTHVVKYVSDEQGNHVYEYAGLCEIKISDLDKDGIVDRCRAMSIGPRPTGGYAEWRPTEYSQGLFDAAKKQ